MTPHLLVWCLAAVALAKVILSEQVVQFAYDIRTAVLRLFSFLTPIAADRRHLD